MATQVGEAVVRLQFDGKNVNAQLGKIGSQMESAGGKSGHFWGSAWAVAAGNLIAKGVQGIVGLVQNSMDSAISRIDIIENFPRVMTAMGFSAEESQASIDKVGDALDGLPSTLDGVINDVQKLAATMGNLNEGEVNATSVGLGLNDMFLAGGKSTAEASAAMEQYNQMLAMGKVDMQSWSSLVNAAPGQMDQLAKSILGADANQADLYQAMQDGTVTFDDMNAAIVRLDQEGGEGFASFYDQAVAATDGIQTQLENIQSSMNKMIGAALQGNMEEVEKYSTQLIERITNLAPKLVQGFATAVGAMFKVVPQLFSELLPVVVDGIVSVLTAIIESLPLFAQAIVDAIPVIMDGVMALLNVILELAPTIIPQVITILTQGVILLAQTLSNPEFLNLLLQAALTLFMEIVKCIPDIVTAVYAAMPSILQSIIGFLTDPETIGMLLAAAGELFYAIVVAVPQILGSLIGAFGQLLGGVWNWIQGAFGQFASNFGNFISGIFKNAINGMISFIENFINTPINLINGFLGIINDAFGWLGVHIDPIGNVHLPRLAQGGLITGPTTALIGEAGDEVVLPLENNPENWAGILASTLANEMQLQGNSGTINVYMENKIDSKLDAADIGRIMMQSIRRAA